MMLHARFAAERGMQNIVVASLDTDVLVLLVHHRPAITTKQMYTLKQEKQENLSCIPIHVIYENLMAEQHSILLLSYCLTGCDTVSSFFGHGKKAFF